MIVLLAAGGGYWFGRGSRGAGVLDSGSDGAVVARFGGHSLHAGEVESSVRVMSDAARAQLASPAARKQLVDGLVRQKLLAQLAEEKGYQRDPEFAKRYVEELGAELRSTVVETPSAFFVVKLVGREEAYEPRFEMVRDVLKSRLTSDRRSADRKQFLDDLWKQADVKIDEEALKSLKLAPAGRT